jgi:hypothetical protein
MRTIRALLSIAILVGCAYAMIYLGLGLGGLPDDGVDNEPVHVDRPR